MSWRSPPLLKTAVLAASALLFAAGPAAAQRGGGGHGGGHGGGGHGGGGSFHGGGFHGGSFYGGGYHHGGYYPGFYGFGLGLGLGLGYAPYYYGGGYYPYYGGSYSTYPDYYPGGVGGYAYLETPVPYRSFYPPPATDVPTNAPADNKAHIRLMVPAEAEVWIEGDKTSQSGTMREFVSPPLAPDNNYTYEIRAQWMENGKPVDQTRKVTVRAGALTVVDFTRPSPAK
jgi:uncharacterized protein (TIGR03000 family)